MWLSGHSRSLKLVPFESLGAVSYSPSIVTISVSVAVYELFSVKACDLGNWVKGHSRSLKIVGEIVCYIYFPPNLIHVTLLNADLIFT